MVGYVGGTATFDDKNVGNGKTVTVTGLSLSGADAGNYTVNTTATTTADITPRALMVSAAGQNKVYDGTTTATVTLSDDRVAGDDLTLSYGTATFADKNVGTGKTVSVSGIMSTGGRRRQLHLQHDRHDHGRHHGSSAHRDRDRPATRIYDGTTAATVTLADDRVAGDAADAGLCRRPSSPTRTSAPASRSA